MTEKRATVSKFALFAIVVVMLAVGGYLLFTRPVSFALKPILEAGKKLGISSTMTNIRITGKTVSNEIWELEAKSVSVNKETTEMDEVRMVYYSKEKGEIELSARNGEMQNGSQDITFSGNVQVKSKRPLTLETEQLDWNAGEHTLTTDKKVSIESGRFRLDGEGLIIDVEKQDLTILHSVTAWIK